MVSSDLCGFNMNMFNVCSRKESWDSLVRVKYVSSFNWSNEQMNPEENDPYWYDDTDS